jgi:hypothetical protein
LIWEESLRGSALLSLRTGRIIVELVLNKAWKNFCRRGRKVREEFPELDFWAKEIRILQACLEGGFG